VINYSFLHLLKRICSPDTSALSLLGVLHNNCTCLLTYLLTYSTGNSENDDKVSRSEMRRPRLNAESIVSDSGLLGGVGGLTEQSALSQ